MRLRRVLITGATGFLGRQVLAVARDRDLVRIALVRDPSAWPYPAHEVGDVVRVAGDLDAGAWLDHPALADGVDALLHLAGHVEHSRHGAEQSYRVNVDGTLAMVRAAKRLGARMVLVSTSGVVGCFKEADAAADEEAPYVEDTVRGWPYYHSKLVAERRARALADELGVELVVLRPPMLYGPGDHRFRTTRTALKVLLGQFPARIAGGVAFTDIRDVAHAVWVAAAHAAPRPVYHLPGETWSVERFFGAVAEAGGVAPPRFEIPVPLARALAAASAPVARLTGKALMPDPVVVEMGAHHWGLTSRYAAEELGFRPRPGAETVRDTVGWLRAHHPALRGH